MAPELTCSLRPATLDDFEFAQLVGVGSLFY